MGFNTLGDSGSILQAGARLFWLSMVLHVITLPCGYGVGATSFAYSGFKSTDVYVVPGSPWTYNSTTGAFYLAYLTGDYDTEWYTTSVSGRFLYPQLVQMKDPTTMAVKSFSTSFIFQIFIENTSLMTPGTTGPGLAFLMVPDNVTIGGNLDYMGLITANTTETSPNLQSDNHTLGVEFDTYLNYEFGDPNNNHVGLDLTSMNSSYVFVPSLIMASEDAEVMTQVWIDYDQSDARVDIYINPYGQGKPATPEGSTQGVDLSFLLEEMYVGFSAAVGIESNNLHTILAWSFSNEGEAPPISIQRDAPTSPGTSPPPPATVPGPSPPPNLSPPNPPPLSSAPPVLPPSSAALPGPTTPIKSPPEPPPPASPTPGPSSPTTSSVQRKLEIIFATLGSFAFGLCCWKIYRIFTYPVLFFLAHASGDGTTKDFTERLSNEMRRTWIYKLHLIRVFFDKKSLPPGLPFPEEINLALSQTRVGVVIVTEDFFENKWPMNELLSFVKSSKRSSRKVRILPLFYTVKVNKVRTMLKERAWDIKWRQMSTTEHPIVVEECREAVAALCNAHGVENPFNDPSYNGDYIKLALKAVRKTYNQMVLWS